MTGVIRCYTDVSIKGNICSVGYVLIRHDGGDDRFLEAASRILAVDQQPYPCSTFDGEYRAAISGARAATEYPDRGLALYVDHTNVVTAIEERTDYTINGYDFQHALFSFLGRFDAWTVQEIDRDANVAHSQAHAGLKLREHLDNKGIQI